MSAIYGVINLTGDSIDEGYGTRFLQEYSKYKIDRHEQKSAHAALMGCAIQYFTDEAKSEVLPIVDEERHLMFTADCILDNRENLVEELGVAKDHILPDGTLIYKAFLKWGNECIHHLRGMFAFVVYDWEKREVYLFNDHFAGRCLFYHVRGDMLYFSTTMFSLAGASDLRFQENERWLVDCITVRGPAMMFETRQTALQDVFMVDAGYYVRVADSKAEYVKYWNPVKTVKVDKDMTDESCERQLKEILGESVRKCLRTNGKVGIKLSSGLDSSTIACLAAPMLSKKDEKLYSYTSVPLKWDGLEINKGYYVDDETEGVMKICNEYTNIMPKFVKCEGMDILNQSEHIMDVWQLPCKSEQNAVWIDEIMKNAEEDGCKVLLSGGTGNCTVSAGTIIDYTADLAKHFHFIKAYKDMYYFLSKYNVKKKMYIKSLVKEQWQYHTRHFRKERMDVYAKCMTRTDIGERYDSTKRLNKVLQYSMIKSYKETRNQMYLTKAYAQMGEIETYNSLVYGILERDPLRNVEFVSFCLRCPLVFFANREYDRRLVREFMRGVVPEQIRTDFRHRGRQSADNAYRIAMSWDEYYDRIVDMFKRDTTLKYIDEKRFKEFMQNLTKDSLPENDMDMRMIIDGYMFGVYLNRLHNYTQVDSI